MATILDIVNGISQVLSNTHDGAIDSEGSPVEMGLRREEGNPLIDSRLIDGFSVRFNRDKMIVSYQYDCKLKHVHDKGFESEIESSINDVVKFIKKEYRKLTKSTLSLKEEGEVDVLVQYVSRVRTTVTANKVYTINGVDGLDKTDPEGLRDNIKKFLDQAPGKKRPKNDKSKSDNFKQFEPWNLQSGQRNTDLK